MLHQVFRPVAAAICLAGTMVASSGALAQDNGDLDYVIAFAGTDIKDDSVFGYMGGIVALNGLGVDGVAFKGFVGGGLFDYNAAPGFLAGSKIEGQSGTFDLLAGYRFHMNDTLIGIYGGVNFWEIDQTCPNCPFGGFGFPGTSVKAIGDETGFKVEAEVTHAGAGPLFVDVRGNYSTAFETYWARARVGANLGPLTIGPEGTVLGNEDYDEARIGGFISGGIGDTPLNLSTSVGYADADGSRGNDSIYGTVGISAGF